MFQTEPRRCHIHVAGQAGGFPLCQAHEPVIQSAIRFIITIQDRCLLLPETVDLLEKSLAALTRLACSQPAVAMKCALTLRRRSVNAFSWVSYAIRLNQDELVLYANGDLAVDDDAPLGALPIANIGLRADGWHYSCGSAEEWLDAVKELFALLETASSPTSLELEVYDMRQEIGTVMAMFPFLEEPQ